ncbi:cystatin-like [Alligator sinensis]|uniref:Egg-white cystatin n=1 Tax=Alligator sinensis TaxID=38654 RepID=A0A1U7SJS5_ALLSI|nr:cystatin-like [Alligator sinensis]
MMATGTWSLWLLLLGCAGILMGLPALGITIPGGLQTISVTNSEVQAATRVAVRAFNQNSNKPHLFRARKILKAQSQVVSGTMYHLTVELQKTQCRRESGRDPQACAPAPANQQEKLICKFQVWSRPWLNDTHVTSQSCVPAQA